MTDSTEGKTSTPSAMTPERLAQIRRDLVDRDEFARNDEASIFFGHTRALLAEVERVTRDLAEARRERDLAIAHDRQPYPTAWAYTQACKTIERMRPVVRAAQEWRDQFARPSTSNMRRKRAVCDAVDAYEAEMDAIAAGLLSDHPERICRRCGGPNVHAWSAPSPLWNQVMRGGDINAPDLFGGIVCTVCFAELAEEAGIAESWRFDAERIHAELATVTPSGRVWNPQTWLWEEPADRRTV